MSEIVNKNGYWMQWVLAALTLIALPYVFSSGASLTMMCLMGFAIIFSLSYNMLLGQTGILSFGHAVYYGMGGFMTAHALNVVAAGKLPIPLPVMPLIGGLAGLFFAMLFGWVSTKRAGTAFSMISLGIGELVAACSLILRGFFGGEGGISTSRTETMKFFGMNFGPQIQVYYLIAAWCLVCIAAMYLFTRTLWAGCATPFEITLNGQSSWATAHRWFVSLLFAHQDFLPAWRVDCRRFITRSLLPV